jgi:hypothetical protein
MLPTFLVIGAKKSATTSLHRALQAHPDVWVPAEKRTEFFSTDAWDLGVAWYAGRFAKGEGRAAVGECSNSYTRWPNVRGVPERVRRVVPEARLVYLVRDPLARSVAHYRHALVEGWEQRPVGEALLGNPSEFVLRSCYALQLQQYLEHFPRDQVLVVTTEDLRDHRAATLARTFEFIGVAPDPSGGHGDGGAVHNRGEDMRAEGSLVRRVRRAPAYRVVRRAVPARIRDRAWRATTRVPEIDPGALELPRDVRDELLDRWIRPDLVSLRGIIGGDFHCWGLLDDT